MHPTDELG